MGSDIKSDDGHDQTGPRSSMIAETLRAAASLRSPESSMQALIGMMIETGPWTAGSICLLSPGGMLHTAAYLDARAVDCDRLQTTFDQGPAYDAVRNEPVQTSADLLEEPRWTAWSQAAADLGVRSTLTLRLFTNGTLGTINLYSTRPVRLEAAAAWAARATAAHVSVVIAAMTTERHLRRAMLSRNVIGQAQGMLMARHGLTADRALASLRRQSQLTNVKLVVLAGRIADTGIVPDLNDGD